MKNPFQNQKINWKYLIIVLILTILAGGSILFWQHREGFVEKEIKRITITTDKSVYFPEETIEVIIENSLDKSIWHKKGTGFAFPSKIQKFENGDWKDIIRYNMCHCVECVYQTPYFVELKPGEVFEDKWDMKIFKGPKRSCDPLSASPGKYRAYFSYFLNKEGREEIREYSNEFILSEQEIIEDETADWKIISDSRIISAINQSRTIMVLIYVPEGSYSNFNCDHNDMKYLCEEIKRYSPDEDRPVIKQSKEAACIYSKLNAKEDYWYCVDSGGVAGYVDSSGTNPAPGDPGFCDGKTFLCPVVGR